MTIIVSVKINDGIVMASDSASTFGNGQIYHNADKIVNLVKGLPIGAMVTGNGFIGNESITTLLKDLRKRLTDPDHQWRLDANTYTVEEVSTRLREFLFEEKARGAGVESWLRVRICGYSAGRPLPEVWEVLLKGTECAAPERIQGEAETGARWDGEYDALNRLLLGSSVDIDAFMVTQGVTPQPGKSFSEEFMKVAPALLVVPAMPTQDAIDLARFLVDTTIGFIRYSALKQPKTVGGPIEIAAITKHEGFRWVQRKHFYPADLNRGDPVFR